MPARSEGYPDAQGLPGRAIPTRAMWVPATTYGGESDAPLTRASSAVGEVAGARAACGHGNPHWASSYARLFTIEGVVVI